MACKYKINGVWYSEEEVKSIFEQSEKKSKEYYDLVDKLESATPEEKQDIEAKIAELDREFTVESKEELPSSDMSTISGLPTSNDTINIYAGANQYKELSNFAIRPFTVNVELPQGEKQFTFQSVEQGFHFYKALAAGNGIIGAKILKTTNGAELRKLTNRSSLPMTAEQVEEWDNTSKSIMLNLMYDSYAQNPQEASKLLDTGDAKITHNQDNTRWKLDFPEIVMTVRDMLREEGFTPSTVIPETTENVPTESLEVKQGVKEIFESNPELANGIYEALGFNNNSESVTLKNIKEVLEQIDGDIKLSDIKIKDDFIDTTITVNSESVGFILIKIVDGKPTIKVTEVFDEFQKQGIAETIYIKINEVLTNLGLGELNSDNEFLKDTKTEQWTLDGEILSKEEKKKITDNVDLLIELEEGGRLGKTKAVQPAIKLWEKLERKGFAEKTKNGYKFKTQITSQQKQQAQQKFQEYVNSTGRQDIEGFKDFVSNENNALKENVKPEVKELFESNPELQSIGTVEQYSTYIDSIFPDYINNFTYEAVEEFLVANKIIDRKC